MGEQNNPKLLEELRADLRRMDRRYGWRSLWTIVLGVPILTLTIGLKAAVITAAILVTLRLLGVQL